LLEPELATAPHWHDDDVTKIRILELVGLKTSTDTVTSSPIEKEAGSADTDTSRAAELDITAVEVPASPPQPLARGITIRTTRWSRLRHI
jgi:hypothetical protein